MASQVVSVAAKLKRIREAFIKQIPTQLETIRAAYADVIQGEEQTIALETLHRRLHTLGGACASFGLAMLSEAAKTGEHLAKDAMRSEIPLDNQWHGGMRESLARMEQEVGLIDPSEGMDFQARELTVVTVDKPERERKCIYLCEDDSFQRLSLTTQIGCFGFEVVSFGELDHLRNAVRNAPPDAIVMDVVFPDRPMGGAEIMDLIQSERDAPIPTVFISSQSDLSHRLSAVRAGSSAYFVKPVNITELCSTLNVLTSAVQPEACRVLIVDDDPQLAEYHALILQEVGMITQTVNDPLQAMTPLMDFNPDLILMDMYMPGCNGMELAKAIRQIGAYFSIPIVFLSSETDIDKQFHAMRMGGDEFLTKPIKPHHLISSVAVRAERMKIIRSNLIRDSMTGLFNHTATKEYLDTAVAQARRTGGEICFAMIDVDRFKLVNDTYGHPIGDQVLIALSRLIGQRLRKTDIVGRFGGEEFAAVLTDCKMAEAVVLLDRLRESFSEILFQAGNETFSSTFSCGVATLSDFGNPSAIIKGADEALYEAKNGGRNRVVSAGKNR
ncbi:MAG: diguanylate cyclase [Desulfuromonadales bacterium]|nr:diguanylate cyclase [Desulfuromonadales bacterium]